MLVLIGMCLYMTETTYSTRLPFSLIPMNIPDHESTKTLNKHEYDREKERVGKTVERLILCISHCKTRSLAGDYGADVSLLLCSCTDILATSSQEDRHRRRGVPNGEKAKRETHDSMATGVPCSVDSRVHTGASYRGTQIRSNRQE